MLLKVFIIWLSVICLDGQEASSVDLQQQQCDTNRDVLLMEDVDGNRNTYFQCKSLGFGTFGYWERNECPNGMVFEFVSQQCQNPSDAVNHGEITQNFNIAILNSSCANGEVCLGDAVCDYGTMTCQCPQGTLPDYATLSCINHTQQPFQLNTQMPPEFVYASFQTTTPSPSVVIPPPQSNVNAEQPVYVVPQSPVEPNPVQQSKIVAPGDSCANGEQCGGGSVCSHVLELCLCPGDLEDFHGQCVHPSAKQFAFRVSVGSVCGQNLECDDNSVCLNGRCVCAEPYVEQNGVCVFSGMTVREVGPGEQCANGEICTRGSVCNPSIPVCVCPPGTEYQRDSCVSVATATTQPTTEQTPQYLFTFPNDPQQFTPKPDPVKLQYEVNKQTEVGAQCSVNTDCMIGAYCKGNTDPPSCHCLSTHINVNSKCEKVIYPGQKGCDYDEQCSAAYAGTKCVNRECVCPEGFKAVERSCLSEDGRTLSPPGGSCYEGQQCTGGSVCRDGWCVCPESSMIVLKGTCILSSSRHVSAAAQPVAELQWVTSNPSLNLSSTASINVATQATTISRKVIPNGNCGPFDECVGGSSCVEGVCLCAAGYSASEVTARCEPIQTEAVTMPQPAASQPQNAVPGEPCNNRIFCTGGSSCINGLCSCSRNQQISNDICVTITTPITSATQSISPHVDMSLINNHFAGVNECDDDTQCPDDRICIMNQCKCKSGFIERDGVCKAIQDMVLTMNSTSSAQQPVLPPSTTNRPTITHQTPSTVSAQSYPYPRPRITGPPIKFPRYTAIPRTTTQSPSLMLGNRARLLQHQNRSHGVCPIGNEPVQDRQTGKLMMCNGMKPRCPPGTYCYVTGYASGLYNCCKSW